MFPVKAFVIGTVGLQKVVHGCIIYCILVDGGDILLMRIFCGISVVFREISAILQRIFSGTGIQTVQFFSGEKVYFPSVYRVFGVNLVLSVLVHVCCNSSADFVAVLVQQGDFIVQAVCRLLLRLWLPHGFALLLNLCHPCTVRSVHHCLNILLAHGYNGLPTVGAYINRPVAVVHKAVFIRDYLYLCRLSAFVRHGIGVAGIERNNTVNAVGFLLSILLPYRFRRSLFLRFRVNRLFNVEYGIRRYHFHFICVLVEDEYAVP